jgi:hypothetical protein
LTLNVPEYGLPRYGLPRGLFRHRRLWLIDGLHLLLEKTLLDHLGSDLECKLWYRHAPPFQPAPGAGRPVPG